MTLNPKEVAQTGDYIYSCSDSILRHNCPIKLEIFCPHAFELCSPQHFCCACQKFVPEDHSAKFCKTGEFPKCKVFVKFRKKQEMMARGMGFRRVPEKDVQVAVEFLKKYWKLGVRNQVEIAFLGYCVKEGFAEEDIRKIIETVCKATNDEETEGRLALVDYHYKHPEPWKFKGIAGIREILQQIAKGDKDYVV